jgi:hypothetical protein
MRPDAARPEYVAAFTELATRIAQPLTTLPYRDPDGAARLLYFDRQYNDTFALLHEDAHQDSVLLPLKGIDPSVLDVLRTSIALAGCLVEDVEKKENAISAGVDGGLPITRKANAK